MALKSAGLGFIAACAAFIALVAQFRFQPFYTWLICLLPRVRRLRTARNLLADGNRIRTADHQDELEIIHKIASEEYENISEQYTPVEFRWMYQAFEIRYAEQRTEGRKNTPGIQEEMLRYFDRRISRALGKVAAIATGAAIIGFVVLLVMLLA